MQLYSFRTVSDAVFLLVALTLAVSSFLLIASTLVDHLRNYKYPSLQACCMRILLLAPIYAVVSWCMMVFLPVSGYIEVLRDAYEGYALYCFWVMLVLWCGGQRKVIEVMAREEKLACFLCPLVQGCGCGVALFRWSSAASFFRFLRIAVTQLMVVKPVVAVLCASIATSGAPSHPRIRHLRLLVLVSTAIAMHSIFTVYMATKPYIRGLQASKKFLLLKVVVATILFQQFAVNAALSMEVIPEGDYGYTAEDRAKRMYCTLTIMEMAVFSLLLSYSFSHTSMTLPDGSGGVKGGSKGASRAHPLSPPAGTSVGASPHRPAQPPLPPPSAPTTTPGFFELVIGDSSSSATRKLAAALPHPEAVSLLPVLAFWDVIAMGRIEELSAAPSGSISGLGVPVESDGVSLINSRDLESAGICMHDLVSLGGVDGDCGTVSSLPQGAIVSPERSMPLQRCSTGGGGATSPATVTTEESVATREQHACNVSTGAWGGWGLSAVSMPRHAAKPWNKR